MTSWPRSFACFVLRPDTLFRHNLKLAGFRVHRMIAITCRSSISNCASMASKGVLSSQAISIILDTSSVDSFINRPVQKVTRIWHFPSSPDTLRVNENEFACSANRFLFRLIGDRPRFLVCRQRWHRLCRRRRPLLGRRSPYRPSKGRRRMATAKRTKTVTKPAGVSFEVGYRAGQLFFS